MKNKKPSTNLKMELGPLPFGMQKTREVRKSDLPSDNSEKSELFTPMETGQPDADAVPDLNNPQAVQGGRGPLNQEGEGERQNSQLAELEEIEPNIK